MAIEQIAKSFLDGIIGRESFLIERLFVQHKMPDDYRTKIILEINAFEFFESGGVSKEDGKRENNKWYSKDFLGGWIRELRGKNIPDKKIYEVMMNAKSKFSEGRRGCSPHKIYDSIIDSLVNLAKRVDSEDYKI